MWHDRKIHAVLGALALATTLGWLALCWLMPLAQAFICGPTPLIQPWDTGRATALILMWSLMSATMMLPCITAPLLAAIWPRRPMLLIPALGFTLGYFAITTLAATGGALLEWTLQSTGLMQAGTPSHPLLTTTFLLAAMLAALASVLRPASERPQSTSAFTQGLHHGKTHSGALLAMVCLQFVGGTMNLSWMAVVTLWMLAGTTMPTALGRTRRTDRQSAQANGIIRP